MDRYNSINQETARKYINNKQNVNFDVEVVGH
jgi:hypothetical protein